jgi:hypothetical protein
MSAYRNSKARAVRDGRPGSRRAIGLGVLGVLLGIGIIAAVSATTAQASSPNTGLPADKAARQQVAIDSARNKTGHLPSKSEVRSQAQAQAMANAAAVDADPAGATAGLTPGIVEQRQGPFSAAEFSVTNMYRAPVGARWLFAFAGATRDENGQPAQGAMRVYQLTASGAYTFVGLYPAPSGTGALRVSAGAGTVLTLATDSGRSLTFDLDGLSYH